MPRLTSSHWPSDETVPLRDLTVGDLLREAAKDSPDKEGLVAGVPGDERRWSFLQMLVESERAAAALLSRFSPGERVAVWAPNLPEWVFVELGAALAHCASAAEWTRERAAQWWRANAVERHPAEECQPALV